MNRASRATRVVLRSSTATSTGAGEAYRPATEADDEEDAEAEAEVTVAGGGERVGAGECEAATAAARAEPVRRGEGGKMRVEVSQVARGTQAEKGHVERRGRTLADGLSGLVAAGPAQVGTGPRGRLERACCDVRAASGGREAISVSGGGRREQRSCNATTEGEMYEVRMALMILSLRNPVVLMSLDCSREWMEEAKRSEQQGVTLQSRAETEHGKGGKTAEREEEAIDEGRRASTEEGETRTSDRMRARRRRGWRRTLHQAVRVLTVSPRRAARSMLPVGMARSSCVRGWLRVRVGATGRRAGKQEEQ